MIHYLHTQPHSHTGHLGQHNDGLLINALQHTTDPHIAQGCCWVCKVDHEAANIDTMWKFDVKAKIISQCPYFKIDYLFISLLKVFQKRQW